jgi:hypothetical protein
VEEIGIVVVGIEIDLQIAVPDPVACVGIEMAVQLDPVVLYSRIKVAIFEAVVDLCAPKDIPTVPEVYPVVDIPSIWKVRDELLVRKTFELPEAPA